MTRGERFRAWTSWSRAAGWMPATLVATALGLMVLVLPGALAAKLATAAAVALLMAVSRASLQAGRQWRVFVRHDSIRADISAAGGLGQRLSV